MWRAMCEVWSRGGEGGRGGATKRVSPTIPEASAAVPAALNCRNDLREAPLPLHRELLSMILPSAILQDLCLAKPLSSKMFALSKNASGKRCALAGSIISEIAAGFPGLRLQPLSAEDYHRSFAANCMLNCSPGPRPGAPLKSPIVSFTCPKPPAFVQ